MWARYIVIRFLIGGRKKLSMILVEFLTVQPVNMVNEWIVNGAVPQIPYSPDGTICHIRSILPYI